MLNVDHPDRDSHKDLSDVIDRKRGEIKAMLLWLHPFTLSRYADFDTIVKKGRLKPVTSTDLETEYLQKLFTSETRTSKDILKTATELAGNTFGLCLSCGIFQFEEIDHFLPKEHFPEFSILDRNLVPICSKCNKLKGARIPGDNCDFLHPFYNKLPDTPIVTCKIDFKKNIPSVTYSVNSIFLGTLWEEHFCALKLKNRFESGATQYFAQVTAIYDQYGAESAKQEIESQMRKLNSCYGPNFWKYQLCLEMNSVGFVEQISS